MNKYTNPAELQRLAMEWWQWVLDNILIWPTAVQAAVIVVALILARWIGPSIAGGLERLVGKSTFPKWLSPPVRALLPLKVALTWLVLQWVSLVVAMGAQWPFRLIESTVSLLTAWVVIRYASAFIRNPGWARTLAVIAWSVAALNLLGLLDPAVAAMDSVAVSLGDVRLSLWGVVKALLVLIALLWLAGILSRLVEARIDTVSSISPSARVLLGKLVRVISIGIAIVAALQSIGVNLAALAVFGGAIGLGIGFGLQKVISNLVSGVILLMDKSVKPGDVIAIGDTFGWINRLSARYVSLITRDGTEHLIPNEDLISQRVENWSYSDSLIRIKLPIGVAYESDVPAAMAKAEEAAAKVARVLQEPKPACRLMNFGDNAVELELRLWIEDPQNGVANVRSEVLLNVWTLYHAAGIEFPFSQRDLHIKSSVPLPVRLDSGEGQKDS